MNYVIFGATSAIAEHTARKLAVSGARLFLVARDGVRLEKIAADLKVRGALYVGVRIYDFLDIENLGGLVESAATDMGAIDGALIAFGSLPDQVNAEVHPTNMASEMAVNYVVPSILSQYLANYMKDRKTGLIVAITSVAGDRGRGSNYIYGSAKGGLSLFLQGLRHKMAEEGVKVLDIVPGFVDTPMTKQFKKSALWATPEVIGEQIARAMKTNKGGRIYLPGFWRPIMFVIRHVPSFIFHKTKL